MKNAHIETLISISQTHEQLSVSDAHTSHGRQEFQ
jgi:hypothetical protein